MTRSARIRERSSVRLIDIVLCGWMHCACSQAAPPMTPATTAPPGKVSDAPKSPPVSAQATPVATLVESDKGMTVAATWLDTLVRGDLPALTRQTGFPFELRDSGKEGHCPPLATAGAASELAGVTSCMRSDDVLTSVLREHSTGGFDPLLPDGLQTWARPWRESLDPTWQLVTGYFSRPDAYVEVNLAIAKDGVRALWKTGMDGTRDAALASQWLAALRAKDMTAIERLSAFPFDLRDTGRHASCGRRVADKPDSMRKMLSCLLGNDVLNQALAESPESPAIVAHPEDEPPEWATSWLASRSSTPSVRVGVLVATGKGDEFELLLLVSGSRVQGIYARGGFEATE